MDLSLLVHRIILLSKHSRPSILPNFLPVHICDKANPKRVLNFDKLMTALKTKASFASYVEKNAARILVDAGASLELAHNALAQLTNCIAIDLELALYALLQYRAQAKCTGAWYMTP